MCSQNLAIGDGKDHVSAKERFYWLELKDVAVAPDYSPKLAVPGRMQFVLKKDSPDTKLGLTLFGVGDALICANLAVESAAYQAGLRDGDCVLTINGVECKEKIVKKVSEHPGRDAAIAALEAARGDVNLWVHQQLCPNVVQIMSEVAAANARTAQFKEGRSCCLVM